MRSARLAPLLPVAALLVLGALVWPWRAMPHLGHARDDAVYLATAHSVRDGHYTIPSLPGAPAQTKYPPLWPVLLAATLPGGLAAAAVLNWLLAAGMAALYWRLLRESGWTPIASGVLAAALLLNPLTVLLTGSLLTELPATLLVLAALVDWRRGGAWMSGVLAAVAALTRTATLPLALAGGWRAWRGGRRREAAGWILPPALAALAWFGWASAQRAADPLLRFQTDYSGWWRDNAGWSDLPPMLQVNLGELFTALGGLLLFRAGDGFGEVLLARLFALAAVVGVVRLWRGGQLRTYTLFAAFSATVLLLWNYPPNERFCYPLLPLLLAGLWTEGLHLKELLARAPLAQAATAAVLLILLGGFGLWRYGWGAAAGVPAMARAAAQRNADLQPAYEWMRRNSAPQAIVQADADAQAWLATGRTAMGVYVPTRLFYSGRREALTGYCRRAGELARRQRADYLLHHADDFGNVLTAEERAAVTAGLREEAGLQLAWEAGPVSIYRVNR